MDSMAQHLVLVLLLGTLLWTSCLAAPTQCHFSSQAQCKHEGKHYSLGESWMESGCLLCTCLHPVGVGCCETVQHPVDYPAGCEVRVETETCRATLVQSADPRLPCIFGALGSVDPNHRALGSQLGG